MSRQDTFFPHPSEGPANLDRYASSSEKGLLTSKKPAVTRYAAAAEELLNVYETSAVRVIFVRLLTFAEVIIFVQISGIDIVASNLAHLFLFNFAEAVASVRRSSALLSQCSLPYRPELNN